MARPVRVDVAGGWYHVTARGIERRAIFADGRDRDLTLCLARRRSGLTLGELGREFGITEYKTVAAAITRFEVSLTKDSAKRKMAERCIREMQKVET